MRQVGSWAFVLTVILGLLPGPVLAQSVAELLQQAQVAKDTGQFQQAERLLQQLIKQAPGDGIKTIRNIVITKTLRSGLPGELAWDVRCYA